MPTIQESLDEAQQNCEALALEIKAFKDARQLNAATTASLETTCAALIKTHDAIRPLTEVRINRIAIILLSLLGTNTLLLLIVLFMLLFK
jgi:hypothetical protein